MHKIKIEQFEGPLDLLLQLIEQNKLEITDISLAHVTEQYVQILKDQRLQISLSELADFLVIASRLLILKSKALLPYLLEEEEGEEDLASQLKIYKEYFEASRKITRILAKKKFAFSRPKFFVTQEIGFQPPAGLTSMKLRNLFQSILDDLDPGIEIPKNIIRKTISIQEKINHIRDILAREMSVNFEKILHDSHDKTEIIVSFLALLELTKQKIIFVQQNGVFDDIVIERI